MRSEAAAGRLDEKMSADGGRSKGQTASGKDDTHTHTRPVPARHIGSLPGNRLGDYQAAAQYCRARRHPGGSPGSAASLGSAELTSRQKGALRTDIDGRLPADDQRMQRVQLCSIERRKVLLAQIRAASRGRGGCIARGSGLHCEAKSRRLFYYSVDVLVAIATRKA